MKQAEVYLRVLGFSLGGGLVFFLFISFLIVGIAQQKVIDNLELSGAGLSYTEAYDVFHQISELDKDLGKVSQELSKSKSQLKSTDLTLDRAKKGREKYAAELQSLVVTADLTKNCPNQFELKGEQVEDDEIMSRVVECSKESDSGISKIYENVAVAYGRLRTFTKTESEKTKEKSVFSIETGGLEARYEELIRQKAKSDKVAPSFLPETRLRETLRLDFLFSIPPSVMPIMMTFFSGLFGALLVNLILIVYPKNSYSVSHAASFTQHVLLGGLIATAIFVVLGAGSSVLGFSGGGLGDPNNYLSFSAIGLFSGMFSNRAADWLSQRADFFKADGAS